jgi:hypothetical protein
MRPVDLLESIRGAKTVMRLPLTARFDAFGRMVD